MEEVFCGAGPFRTGPAESVLTGNIHERRCFAALKKFQFMGKQSKYP